MKAKEVRKIMGITQKTLNTYMKKGMIHPIVINSHHYEYDDDEIYSLMNKVDKRLCISYARVSSGKQKEDLAVQNSRLYDFALRNGYSLDAQYEDVKSGLGLEGRKGLQKIIDLVSKREVKYVIIEQPDRLCRFGFDIIEEMFRKNGAEIVCMSKVPNMAYADELKRDISAILKEAQEDHVNGERYEYAFKEVTKTIKK